VPQTVSQTVCRTVSETVCGTGLAPPTAPRKLIFAPISVETAGGAAREGIRP
jgi:hypothetical protein